MTTLVDDDSPDGEDRPRTVRVPVGPPDPFGDYGRTLEVDEEVAAHWSSRVWHDRPPR